MYDLYTPIVRCEFNIPYEDGQQLILKGLHPLKDEYLDVVKEGFNSRWIDVYENPGKGLELIQEELTIQNLIY